MTHRLVRLLAVVGMAGALATVPTAAQANATTSPAAATAEASMQTITPQHKIFLVEGTLIHCVQPFLTTLSGSLSQCLQVVGNFGRIGFYNRHTNVFKPGSDFYQLVNANFFTDPNVCATDGVCGVIGGYGVLATPFGATIFVLQYVSNIARWGNWNLHTDKFYPGSAWARVEGP